MSQPIPFRARSRDFARNCVSDWSTHPPIMQKRSLPVMRYCKDSTTGASSNCCEVSLAEAIVFLKLRSRQQRHRQPFAAFVTSLSC